MKEKPSLETLWLVRRLREHLEMGKEILPRVTRLLSESEKSRKIEGFTLHLAYWQEFTSLVKQLEEAHQEGIIIGLARQFLSSPAREEIRKKAGDKLKEFEDKCKTFKGEESMTNALELIYLFCTLQTNFIRTQIEKLKRSN